MIKCAIVHVPKLFLNKNNLPASYLNTFATGLFSMGFELKKAGIDVQIINLGAEKYLDPKFSLSEYAKENQINFVAFSLHWYYQAFDVIECAKILKEKNKDVIILLGGYTASFFADEIMNNFPFIDGIIKGEGEIPIVKTMLAFYNKSDLKDVSNIYYRKNNKIVLSDKLIVADDEKFNEFCFFAPELVKNYKLSLNLPFYLNYKEQNEFQNAAQNVVLGRGCMGNCAWCGGGYKAQKILNGRNFITYRNIDNVISDIKKMKNFEIQKFMFSFDPNPNGREYLTELLKRLKEEFKGNIISTFNLNGLADKKFLTLFKETFDNNSTLFLNVGFEDENLRKKYKSFSFSNNELEKFLNLTDKFNLKIEIFFAKMDGIDPIFNQKSEKYGDFLMKNFKSVQNSFIHPFDIDPASPLYIHPEKYDMQPLNKKFADFYNENKSFDLSFENPEIFN